VSARRLYAASLSAGAVRLDDAQAKHARVLRLREGDRVVLFDGQGREADAVIVAIDEDGVRCESEAPRAIIHAGPEVVLCQCLPKGGKLEDIVRACTELGVTAVHLVASERSVPRMDADRIGKRLDRLERVAVEASRQSGRSDVPDLLAPAPLDAVLDRAPGDAAKIAFAPEMARSLSEACAPDARAAWVLIGPEGGLTPDELERARARGFRTVGLGPTVLRVETAAPVAVALVLDRLGGLRPHRRERDIVERDEVERDEAQ
jgi:16S rRNA (uracil1498-N3)-methyltransferase